MLREWVDQLIQRSPPQKEKALDPVLQDFKNMIESDPLIRMNAIRMFLEVPITPPYNKDPTGLQCQVRDYGHMLELMNMILGEGPQWYDTGNPDTMGLIGFPINAILDWPMGTQTGYTFFTTPLVNTHFKAVLDKWKDFLMSSASKDVLNSKNGWTSSDALNMLTAKGNDGTDKHTFTQLYKCPDPSKPGLGFPSWDAFFTREFQDNVRPIAGNAQLPPGTVDPSQILVHACESTPCLRQENVQLHDTFWLKSQPYSLADMLNSAETAAPFVGGQVYQAFLSALSYH